MRRFSLAALMGLIASLLLAVPAAQATNSGTDEGCTPGYWKNHPNNWFEEPGVKIPTTWKLNSAKVGFKTTDHFADTTLLEALNLKGGTGLKGAEATLLRAAAASWLNAAHEGIGFPYRRLGGDFPILKNVNDAIASGDRAKMLEVKDVLDAANNLGCPL